MVFGVDARTATQHCVRSDGEVNVVVSVVGVDAVAARSFHPSVCGDGQVAAVALGAGGYANLRTCDCRLLFVSIGEGEPSETDEYEGLPGGREAKRRSRYNIERKSGQGLGTNVAGATANIGVNIVESAEAIGIGLRCRNGQCRPEKRGSKEE